MTTIASGSIATYEYAARWKRVISDQATHQLPPAVNRIKDTSDIEVGAKRENNVLDGNRSRTHLGVGMFWLHHQQSLENLGKISQVKRIVALRWRWQQLVRNAFVDFYRGCYQRLSHRLQTGNSCL